MVIDGETIDITRKDLYNITTNPNGLTKFVSQKTALETSIVKAQPGNQSIENNTLQLLSQVSRLPVDARGAALATVLNDLTVSLEDRQSLGNALRNYNKSAESNLSITLNNVNGLRELSMLIPYEAIDKDGNIDTNLLRSIRLDGVKSFNDTLANRQQASMTEFARLNQQFLFGSYIALINPEAAYPHLSRLQAQERAINKALDEARLMNPSIRNQFQSTLLKGLTTIQAQAKDNLAKSEQLNMA